MLYAFSTHETLDSGEPEKWNNSAMFGTAMLTIVASTNAMNVPSTATASTAFGVDTRRSERGARSGSRPCRAPSRTVNTRSAIPAFHYAPVDAAASSVAPVSWRS